MGTEFQIAKEMATISVTVIELAAVNNTICEEIPVNDFQQEYQSLISDILNTFEITYELLKPLVDIRDAADFARRFKAFETNFLDKHESVHSESRINAEHTYEKYLQFRKRKETQTSFPILKKTFARLHDFIDKWIDNDIWLSLTIDSMFKMIRGSLTEIAKTNTKDPDSAYSCYSNSLKNLQPYIAILESKIGEIKTMRNAMSINYESSTAESLDINNLAAAT